LHNFQDVMGQCNCFMCYKWKDALCHSWCTYSIYLVEFGRL